MATRSTAPARVMMMRNVSSSRFVAGWEFNLSDRLEHSFEELKLLGGPKDDRERLYSETDLLHERTQRRQSFLQTIAPAVFYGRMDQSHWLRRICLNIFLHPWFDKVILLLIFANTIALACRDPGKSVIGDDDGNNGDDGNEIFYWLEWFFNSAFTVEMVIKMISLGLTPSKERIELLGKKAWLWTYFGDAWNRLDFFVVLLGWLPILLTVIAPELASTPNFTFIRALRVLKVLRTARQVHGMRKLVASLLNSLPLLVNVMYLVLFIFLIFGILGNQLFMGTLRQHCLDEDTQLFIGDNLDFCSKVPNMGRKCDSNTLDSLTCTRKGPDGEPNENPVHGYISFDDVPLGFLTILTSISLEGWVDTLYYLMDAVGWVVVIYFICLIFFGALFVVNLVIAVIYEAYLNVQEEEKRREREKKIKQLRRQGTLKDHAQHQESDEKDDQSDIEDDQSDIEDDQSNSETEDESENNSKSIETELESPKKSKSDAKENSRERERSNSLTGHFDLVIGNASLAPSWRINTKYEGYVKDVNNMTKLDTFLFKIGTLRDNCHNLMNYYWFIQTITMLIILNTIILALEHDGQSSSFTRFLEICNLVFTILFSIEAAIKIAGTGWSNYIKDPFNIFDFIVVLVSLLEIAIIDDLGVKLTILRSFRLLRTIRMMRQWKTLNQLISTVTRAGPSLVNFSFILALFIFIYALCGMEIYGGAFGSNNGFDSVPRHNFDTLGQSLLTVFQVLTGENWNEILYDGMRVNGIVAAIFFSSMFLIGNYIALNLFLAILLDNFDLPSSSTEGRGVLLTIHQSVRERGKIIADWIEDKLGCIVVAIIPCAKRDGYGEGSRRRSVSGDSYDFDFDQKEGNGNKKDKDDDDERIIPLEVDTEFDIKNDKNDPSFLGRFSRRINETAGGFRNSIASMFRRSTTRDSIPLVSPKTPQFNASRQAQEDLLYLESLDLKEIAEYLKSTLESGTHHRGFQSYFECFVATEVVDVLMDSWFDIPDERRAVLVAQELVKKEHMLPVYTRLKGTIDSLKRRDSIPEEDEEVEVIEDGIHIFSDFELETARHNAPKSPIIRNVLNSPLTKQMFPEMETLNTIDEDEVLKHRRRESIEDIIFNHDRMSKLNKKKDRIDQAVSTLQEEQSREEQEKIELEESEEDNSSDMKQEDSMDDLPPLEGMISINVNRVVKNDIKDDETKDDENNDDLVDEKEETKKEEEIKGAQVTSKTKTSRRRKSLTDFIPVISRKKKKEKEEQVMLKGILKRHGIDGNELEGTQDPDKVLTDMLNDKTGGETRYSSFLQKNKSFLKRSTSFLTHAAIKRKESMLQLIRKKKKEKNVNSSMDKVGSKLVVHKFEDNEELYRFTESSMHISKLIIQSWHHKNEFENEKKKEVQQIQKSKLQTGISLWLFPHDHPIRNLCVKIITDPKFDSAILFLILVSSILLALDRPDLDEDSTLAKNIYIIDFIITILFTLEVVAKVISMGFIFGKYTYLHDGWNQLDFVIIGISLLTLILSDLDLGYLKALRAVRALRPLRVISRYDGMRTVVNALLIALPSVLNVVVILGFFFIIFAILGGTLFGGLFNYCDGDPDTNEKYLLDREDCVGNWTDINGMTHEREWVNQDFNFDNVGNSLVTLFEVASLERWPLIMYTAIDTTTIDNAPKIDANPGNSLYFVIFLIIGSFFVINLFVGVVIGKFSEMRAKQEGHSLFLTPEQEDWIEVQKQALKTTPLRIYHPPDVWGRYRAWAYKLHYSKTFELGILFIICLNTIILSMEHYDQSDTWTEVLYLFNLVFAAIFVVEMLIKIWGLGWQYWESNWNRLDFLIVLGAIADIFQESLSFDFTLLRILRMARIMRIIRVNEGLQALFETLFLSLPSLGNVGSLLFLFLYIFAVMGMNLFGDVENDGEWLHRHNNFQSFFPAMLTLFRCSTGESWNGIMHYLEDQGHPIAIPYFFAFVILCSYMLLNLFVAVILENFHAIRGAKAADKKYKESLAEFRLIWGELDTNHNLFLPGFEVVTLLLNISPPLGWKGTEKLKLAYKSSQANIEFNEMVVEHIRSLNIRQNAFGQVFFVDVLSSLLRDVFLSKDFAINESASSLEGVINKELSKYLSSKIRRKMEKMEQQDWVPLDLSPEYNAATGLQMLWRGSKVRKQFFQTLKDEGKWTPRLEHLFSVTLNYGKNPTLTYEGQKTTRKKGTFFFPTSSFEFDKLIGRTHASTNLSRFLHLSSSKDDIKIDENEDKNGNKNENDNSYQEN